MTDIPGTSKTTLEIEKEKEKESVALSVTNVREIKRLKKWGPPKPEDNLSQSQPQKWLLIGSIPVPFFILLGLFFHWSFLLMIPAGPVIALLSWHVANAAKRYEDKSRVLK